MLLQLLENLTIFMTINFLLNTELLNPDVKLQHFFKFKKHKRERYVLKITLI